MSQAEAAYEDEPMPADADLRSTAEPDDVTPAGHPDAAQTGILVFTRDATLIDTVRKAAPADATVIQAQDLDQVTSQLPVVQPDVLLLDAACAADIPGMAEQLAHQFPDLVTIVAGRREESTGLMKLAAAGRIYRFLLVPLALGQTRLTLEAALRRHVERTLEGVQPDTHAHSPPPRRTPSRLVLAGGVAACVVAAAAAWYLTQSPDTDRSSASRTPLPATPQESNIVNPAAAELALARSALEQGNLVEPVGASALDHYRTVLAGSPDNAEAQAGIRSVADLVIGRAEAALLAEQLELAVAALEQARNIMPGHPRLTFLDAQLERERERLQLSQARDVSERLRGLLATATTRMEAGQLVTPAGSSARDALVEARGVDATDPAVIQGFRALTTRVLEEAERARAAGERDQATGLLAVARELGPGDARIADLERAIREPAQPAATAGPSPDALLARARARLAEGRLIDPAGDSARDHLAAVRSAEPGNIEADRLLIELKTRLVDAGRRSLSAGDLMPADRFVTAAASLRISEGDDALTGLRRDLEVVRAERAFRENVVSAGSLARTRTVPPQYPENARRRGIAGWVDLNFTVTENGSVADVEVTGAEPADVFEPAAINAVRQWRFDPVIRGGAPVAQRAATRIRFDIEN